MKMVDKRPGVYMYVVSEGGGIWSGLPRSRVSVSRVVAIFFVLVETFFLTENIRRLERAFLIAWNAISNGGMVKGIRCFVIPLHKQKSAKKNKQKSAKKKKSRPVPSAKRPTRRQRVLVSRAFYFPRVPCFCSPFFSTKAEQRTRTEDWAVRRKYDAV